VAALLLKYRAATSTGWKQIGHKIGSALTAITSFAGLSAIGISMVPSVIGISIVPISALAATATSLIVTWTRNSESGRAVLNEDLHAVSQKLPDIYKVINHAQSTFDRYGKDSQDPRTFDTTKTDPQEPHSFDSAERNLRNSHGIDAAGRYKGLYNSGNVLTRPDLLPASTTFPSRISIRTDVGCDARNREGLTRAMENLAAALSTAKDRFAELQSEREAISDRLMELDRARDKAANLLAELETAIPTASWWATFLRKIHEWLRFV
jgi:hypothetical protein